MTWGEWVNSSFNTEGFTLGFTNEIMFGALSVGTNDNYVSDFDKIIENYNYLLIK